MVWFPWTHPSTFGISCGQSSLSLDSNVDRLSIATLVWYIYVLYNATSDDKYVKRSVICCRQV